MKRGQGINLKIRSCGFFVYFIFANAYGFFVEINESGRTHHARKYSQNWHISKFNIDISLLPSFSLL
jgi:hypothetical protein